jgi:putative transposase
MIYHVTNRSIADFIIFNDDEEFMRMTMAIRYYRSGKPIMSLSQFLKLAQPNYKENEPHSVNILAYCLMPTHIHLLLKEIEGNGISKFINNTLNSYTRYFNLKHKRKGSLWEGKSKKIEMNSDEQLLHTTRYIHLNPVTAYIVNKPEDWQYSSYREYMNEIDDKKRICKYSNEIDIGREQYMRFTEDQIPYQRELAKIKARMTIV